MSYNNTHGIVTKTQLHTQDNVNNPTNTYSNKYDYYSGTHKVKEIVDLGTNFTENFEYDFNGNLVNKSNSDGDTRRLFWDESNRLRVIDENNQMQHYIYDAAGEHTLKASSHVEQVYENGQLVNSSTITFSSYTTYPSAFIVIDANQQYSKHYYAGSQRIVSKLGEQDISIFAAKRKPSTALEKEAKEPNVSYETIKQTQITDLQAILDKAKRGKVLFKEYKTENEPVVDNDGIEKEKRPSQVGIYFFHPDHLGSSTFLTDGSGNPYQFFINLPFGETMYEQHSYSENFINPYKFNGKEQDIEIGLYYYGARYYDPKTSIWLSVDPLAEKFPNWNPYNYTMQNPINLTDPTGMAPEEGTENKQPFNEKDTKKINQAKEYIGGIIDKKNDKIDRLNSKINKLKSKQDEKFKESREKRIERKNNKNN
ncbi:MULTISPECIES: RHS repeat domain-containing protein [Flavobacterium]|uniref:RHS repeat domain-containing protein n=1 Tax=Flavobacterium jumunjinense TaxID=998845 RepID=A0ABV5GJZ4_9FLAO|nr:MULTISPECIES: RHS repeat-associated core domain-containing protein [Flavobacterium]